MHKYLIYLASGNGSRFGKNKLLEEVNGFPLYQHGLHSLIKAAKAVPDCSILVVSRYDEIRDYAASLGVKTVPCPDSILGVSHTIRAGIQAIDTLNSEDYLLFSVADQPEVSSASILRLLKLADGCTVTARLFSGDTPGNPVLFSAALASELLSLQGDQGGGWVLKNHPCIPVPIENPRELWDIDRIQDLDVFLHR